MLIIHSGSMFYGADSMLRVGVTGGLCAGKGLVTGFFSALGAATLDADVVARAILDGDEDVRRRIMDEFGPGVVGEDGGMDRRKLAERAFTDRDKLNKLNDIVHPKVKAAIRDWLREKAAAGEKEVAVVNVPLLMETGMLGDFDAAVVVSASEEDQVLRCVKRDGLSRREALARIRAQLPLSEKERRADYIVRNYSGREAVKKQVNELWTKLTGR